MGAGGLGIDFRVGQVGQNVVNGSPSLRRFFGAVERGDGPRRQLHASA